MLIPELKYEGYRIYEGKADSFPASALADETVSTLEITLADPSYGLAVILRYSVYEEEDVIHCATVFMKKRMSSCVRCGLRTDLKTR